MAQAACSKQGRHSATLLPGQTGSLFEGHSG